MRQKVKALIFSMVSISIITLTGCGYKGDLQRPSDVNLNENTNTNINANVKCRGVGLGINV